MSLHKIARVLPSFTRHCARLATIQQQQKHGYADMAFTFASPASVYYNAAKVMQVDVPSFSGSFGILPDHVPSLAVLKPGLLTVFEEDGKEQKFFVSSGSVTINDDSSVQILAEEAVPLEQLDPQMVRDGLSKATQDMTTASTETAKAEAEISVECYEALQKALGA